MRKFLLASVLAAIPVLAHAKDADPFKGLWYLTMIPFKPCVPTPLTPVQFFKLPPDQKITFGIDGLPPELTKPFKGNLDITIDRASDGSTNFYDVLWKDGGGNTHNAAFFNKESACKAVLLYQIRENEIPNLSAGLDK
jgi:hypothetical protein